MIESLFKLIQFLADYKKWYIEHKLYTTKHLTSAPEDAPPPPPPPPDLP